MHIYVYIYIYIATVVCPCSAGAFVLLCLHCCLFGPSLVQSCGFGTLAFAIPTEATRAEAWQLRDLHMQMQMQNGAQFLT